MRKKLLLLILSCFIISCSTTKKAVEKPANENSISNSVLLGDSYDNAIVIDEKGESKGVAAEYAWLRKNYPGYTSKGQSLNFYKKKPYDIIHIITSSGKEKSIYFDISKFFGNY